MHYNINFIDAEDTSYKYKVYVKDTIPNDLHFKRYSIKYTPLHHKVNLSSIFVFKSCRYMSLKITMKRKYSKLFAMLGDHK